MDLKDFEQTKKILFKHEIMEELVKGIDAQCCENIGVSISDKNVDTQYIDNLRIFDVYSLWQLGTKTI